MLREEERRLSKDKRQASRDADGLLTSEMKEEIITLLQLCGVPYLVRHKRTQPLGVLCCAVLCCAVLCCAGA